MDIKTPIVKQLATRRAKQLERYHFDADLIQEHQLNRVISTLSRTKYGAELCIQRRTSYKRYTKQVPLVKYEHIAEKIEQMLQGQKHVLTDERTSWFAKSGGTTNAKSKYVPANQLHLKNCHFKGGLDATFIYLLNHPESELFAHKAFALAGSYDKTFTSGRDIHTGDLSAVLLMKMPAFGRMLRVPSVDLVLYPEWERKLDLVTDAILKEDISNISGVPSWMLSVMKELLRKSGLSTIKELWPNLEVFFHGGIAFGPYEKEYHKVLGEGVNYQEIYNASEGFFGIQDDPSDRSMLLMLDYGVFYEFIPMDQFDENDLQNCPTIPLQDVELGKNYAIVISTLGGLYRYIIGDTVSFTSRDPYKFIITGRTKSFINAFGEELMVTNADEAFNRLSEELNIKIREYTAGPVFLTEKGKGYHHWVLEWEDAPADMDYFAKRFDEVLQELNSDYEAKRYKNFSLQPPRIDVVPQGTFYEWMRAQGKLGGQNKVIRLTKNDEIVRELLAIAQNMERR